MNSRNTGLVGAGDQAIARFSGHVQFMVKDKVIAQGESVDPKAKEAGVEEVGEIVLNDREVSFKLPKELWLKILGYLDWCEMLQMRTVSRYFLEFMSEFLKSLTIMVGLKEADLIDGVFYNKCEFARRFGILMRYSVESFLIAPSAGLIEVLAKSLITEIGIRTLGELLSLEGFLRKLDKNNGLSAISSIDINISDGDRFVVMEDVNKIQKLFNCLGGYDKKLSELTSFSFRGVFKECAAVELIFPKLSSLRSISYNSCFVMVFKNLCALESFSGTLDKDSVIQIIDCPQLSSVKINQKENKYAALVLVHLSLLKDVIVDTVSLMELNKLSEESNGSSLIFNKHDCSWKKYEPGRSECRNHLLIEIADCPELPEGQWLYRNDEQFEVD